jgi:hypothetical protein
MGLNGKVPEVINITLRIHNQQVGVLQMVLQPLRRDQLDRSLAYRHWCGRG